LIQEKKVWNPTAIDLMDYHFRLNEAKITYEKEKLQCKNAPGPIRWID
jgi:hypothetical protein